MSAERDVLRSLTLGAPARQMKRRLVPIRNSSAARALEVELDEEGKPKLEQVLEAGKPLFDDEGKPVMREVKRYRHPPAITPDGRPAQVEVREPGLKQRAAIFRAAGVSSGDTSSIDMAALQVETVVALTYEPGTNVKIFTDADKPALMAQLAGGFVDDIFEIAYPLMNAAKEEEVEKN